MEAETLYGVRLAELFSLGAAIALPCWLLLLVAPRWRVSQLLATFCRAAIDCGVIRCPVDLAQDTSWLRFQVVVAGERPVSIAICTARRVDPLHCLRSLYRSMAGARRKAGWDLSMACGTLSPLDAFLRAGGTRTLSTYQVTAASFFWRSG